MTQAAGRTGADVLCDTLLANGVDTCFANPGTSEMHFVAALDRKPAMRCVLGLFEGVVTGMADGYYRMAGKPAATLLHTGPGLANGLANLHNAKRAGSGIINIVGDHPDHHIPFDASLTSDIHGLAATMSAWVRRVHGADSVAADAAAAIAAAQSAGGQITTLILPADASWQLAAGEAARAAPLSARGVPDHSIDDAVQRLRSGRRTMLMLGGRALSARGNEAVARIVAASGAQPFAQQANARMARGIGRHPVPRIPYRVGAAREALAEFEEMLLIGGKAPVAFFAYPDQPSRLWPDQCNVTPLAGSAEDPEAVLERLADALGGGAASVPLVKPPVFNRAGPLTLAALAACVGARLPEDAIVVDEAVSSSAAIYAGTATAARHDYLQVTGGAIGDGVPLATGAAIGGPGRRVVAIQGDGSGLYTLQGLWTQAREQLDVVTIILANRGYEILKHELAAVGASEPGHNARAMLEIASPEIEWSALARGFGVVGERADTIAQFDALLAAALQRSGPSLIEARIAA